MWCLHTLNCFVIGNPIAVTRLIFIFIYSFTASKLKCYNPKCCLWFSQIHGEPKLPQIFVAWGWLGELCSDNLWSTAHSSPRVAKIFPKQRYFRITRGAARCPRCALSPRRSGFSSPASSPPLSSRCGPASFPALGSPSEEKGREALNSNSIRSNYVLRKMYPSMYLCLCVWNYSSSRCCLAFWRWKDDGYEVSCSPKKVCVSGICVSGGVRHAQPPFLLTKCHWKIKREQYEFLVATILETP